MRSSRVGRGLAVLPLLLALAVGMAGSVFAQSRTGTLAGTVIDVSGAILADADVTVTNEASKDVRRTKSNSEGFFSFAALPNGKYTVNVVSAGFAPFERRGIALGAGDNRSLGSLQLELAGVQTEVTVGADIDLAPTTSGEKSATITAEQIENITIVGRSAAELLKLLPGLTPQLGADNRGGYSGEVTGINGNGEGGKQSAIGNFSGNGARTDALDITIDGAPGADPGCNCATPVNPNKEFVEEFKVLQSNFGAEHAKGPVTMNVVSKSGGRDFHGSLYSYVRDYHLNSNEWQQNKVGNPRVENKFFFPGGTLSGPLLIPGTDFNKDRNKAFFFVGFEYMKQRLDTGIIRSYVPTQAMRNGDFSGAGSLGLGGAGVGTVPSGYDIVNGVIPSGSIDPGGRALVGLLPLPNVDPAVANGYNYQQQIPVDQNGTQLLTRIDFNISDSTKLFVRYNRQRETQPFPVGLWWRNPEQVPYPSAVTAPNQSDSGTLSLTNVFNPTLTNEAIFAVTYINFPNQYEDPSKVSRAGTGYPYQGIFKQSNDQIPAITSWGGAPTMLNPGGFDPVLFAKKWQVSFADNLTKVAGAHTMKFGGYYEWVNNNQPGNDYSNGLIINANWAGGSTGNPIADLMLGRAGQYQESSKNPLLNEAYNVWEAYAQDSWRVKPRLTVDYGIRIGALGPWYDREGNGMVVFDPAQYDPNSTIAARSGLVYNKIDSSIPLSGVDTKSLFFSPRFGFAWDVKGTGDTLLRGGFGMFRYHDPQNPAASALSASTDFVSTTVGSANLLRDLENFQPGTAKPNINAWAAGDDQQPLTYSWSLTYQQRLPWSMTLETAYVGNKAKYLPSNGGLANLNYVPFGAMLGNPDGDPNAYRPYQNYGTIAAFGHQHYQNYHGWQSMLARQRGRVNFTLAYTFSKNLGIRGGGNGDTGSTDVNSPELGIRNTNYGVLLTDRTHVVNLGYSIQLPDVKQGGLMQFILGGWQLSGVTTFISGAALNAAEPNFNITGTAADGSTISNTRVSGSPDIGAFPTILCNPSENVPSGYMLNPACYGAPLPGQNGNYASPTVRGPWYQNHNLSVFKNFGLGSGGRHKLQFRMEAYNFLNHPLTLLDTNNNLTARFTNGVLTDTNFGKSPDDNKFGRRIVQLALRYSF
jgi:hypothetical protein